MQLPLMEVRDRRQKEWFWIDNALLDGFAKVLGPNATLVYIALTRHADNDLQQCWPSMDTIAEEVGLKSRKTVSNGIKALEKYGLIETAKSHNPTNGHRLNNVYTLLSRKHWKLPGYVATESEKPQVTDEVKPQQPKLKPDEVIHLPDWLNVEAWQEWMKYRSDIKKKMTPKTVKMQLNFLSLHQRDHVGIIKQSIMNGWTGLFPLKNGGRRPAQSQPQPQAGKYSNVSKKV